LTDVVSASVDLRTKHERSKYVSVATSAYSGATLLAFLLNAHPQIVSIGEMDGLIPSEDPEEYLCSCGQRIKDCDFWHSVSKSMTRRGYDFNVADFDMIFKPVGSKVIKRISTGSSRNRSLDRVRDTLFQAWPAESRRRKEWVNRNVAFVEAVLEVTDKKVFVDTSKGRWRLKLLHEYSNLDVRAIHLVRDVKGVVNSRLRRRVDLEAREAARQWVNLNQKLEITLQDLPKEKQIQIRYEDLCQDVQGTLAGLYAFCGVDSSIEIKDLVSTTHHIVGNTMRLSSLSRIKLDERWKSELGKTQQEEINRAAANFMERYGYSQAGATMRSDA